MNVDGAGTSSAMRRRQRRLRAMLGRQTVAMELAAALHHSRDAGPETYAGLRAQKTASSGQRPGVLTEPEPQGGAVTVGYVAAPGPLLSTPSRSSGRPHFGPEEGGGGGQEEKYLAKMKLLNDRVSHDLPLTEAGWAAWRQWMGLVPSSSGRRRKRKKRRKGRLPRGVWIRRCGQGFHSRSSVSGACTMLFTQFPLVVGRPEMLGIMAGTYQKDSCALLMSGPRCSASWPVWIRRTVAWWSGACCVQRQVPLG